MQRSILAAMASGDPGTPPGTAPEDGRARGMRKAELPTRRPRPGTAPRGQTTEQARLLHDLRRRSERVALRGRGRGRASRRQRGRLGGRPTRRAAQTPHRLQRAESALSLSTGGLPTSTLWTMAHDRCEPPARSSRATSSGPHASGSIVLQSALSSFAMVRAAAASSSSSLSAGSLTATAAAGAGAGAGAGSADPPPEAICSRLAPSAASAPLSPPSPRSAIRIFGRSARLQALASFGSALSRMNAMGVSLRPSWPREAWDSALGPIPMLATPRACTGRRHALELAQRGVTRILYSLPPAGPRLGRGNDMSGAHMRPEDILACPHSVSTRYRSYTTDE